MVSKIVCPPYDVVSSKEARIMAEGNKYSFLRVEKPEISLSDDIDPYSDQVY